MQQNVLLLLVCAGIGAAIGGMLRFAAGRVIDSSSFPWATFAVNLIACFSAAFIITRFGGSIDESLRVFLIVGVMGGLSTMSTFTTETVNMLYDRLYGMMALNIFANVGICIVGAIVGREFALMF